jgi:transglutaminase-like putative cysteine protease
VLLTIRAELVYAFSQPTQLIAAVEAAQSADQTILEETLEIDPPAELTRDRSATGERRFRARVSGDVTIRYTATVDNGVRPLLPPQAVQHSWIDLPAETLPYLLPSRFCPSDKFIRYANREFGDAADGVGRVMAVLDWMSRHVDYVHGSSSPETTAERTFVDRAGVCRDFSHLGITLCRALGIPARAVAAYALALEPPDFHAVFEVYLDGQWWLVDPTRLAPVAGLVRIAEGRDAADIAFLTTDQICELKSKTISVIADQK